MNETDSWVMLYGNLILAKLSTDSVFGIIYLGMAVILIVLIFYQSNIKK